MEHAKRAVGVLVALTAVLALASPAAAEEPPGLTGLPEGEWIAFTLGATSFTAPRGESTWGPVTVDRVEFISGSIQDYFDNWSTDSFANALWPHDWSVSGFTFHTDDDCPAAQSSCSYTITGGGGTFQVGAGTPLLPGQSLPDPQTVTLTPGLPAEIAITVDPNLSPVQGEQGQPGTITLDASGTTDGDTDPDSLQYAWTVTGNGVTVTATGKVATVELAKDGQYSVSLAVTNPIDGHTTTYDGAIAVTGVAPAEPTVGPRPTPGGGGGSGGTPGSPPAADPVQAVDPGAGAAPIVFAAPRRSVPSALSGGQSGEAQVVWLWRPEWAGAVTGPRAPRTASPPVVREHDQIIVGSSGPSTDADATPWLAGLAVFGLLGAGVIVTRRRRLRRAEL